MNIRYYGVLLAGVVLLLNGCTVIRELPKQETVKIAKNDPEYLLCRELLKAFLKDNGKKFISLLPEEMQKNFTLEQFKSTRKYVTDSMGQPISFQYVTKLELATFSPHIWKIRFKRVDQKTKQEFTSELLFRIITGKLDKKAIITGFQFI